METEKKKEKILHCCCFLFVCHLNTEGQIAFRATCEGSAIRPTHPFRYVTPEGDDSSSEGITITFDFRLLFPKKLNAN